MRKAGLDAIVVTLPLNVYYATNAVPVLSRFSTVNTTAAIVPADPSRPVAYLAGGFEYYAGSADSGIAEGVALYLTGGAFGSADPLSNPAFAYAGDSQLDTRERFRRAQLNKASPLYGGLNMAGAKALSDLRLSSGTIGIDSPAAALLVSQGAPRANRREAEDTLLHIRFAKTSAELSLIRQAAANNLEAAVVAAKSVREAGDVFRVRQRFYQEAAARGNVGVYGAVDLVMSELATGSFREGQTFMIDFVSHYGFYQGDYGRTVLYGEPAPEMKRACLVGTTAWREIREHLKPGLTFSEIRALGNQVVRKMGASFIYAFNPHSVGLQHWDQPMRGIDGNAIDLALEPGMILSVDCPLLNAGVNGTFHVEDLVLITGSGYELMHRESDNLIQV